MRKPPCIGQQLNLAMKGVSDSKFHGVGFLRAVRLQREEAPGFDGYPFNIPALRDFERMEFHPAVTFFIGENGSGKSTLLEAIAVRMGFNPEGGGRQHKAATRPTHSCLHEHLVVERNPRYPTDGWFLRAESMYNVATEIDEVEEENPSGYRAYGGKSLHAQSHGEAFLMLLQERLQGDGLYLFDEPEAALSPQRQLAVLALLHRLVYHRSQLVIATHSPILLGYPNARIYEFTGAGIRETRYTETEHFQVTKDFLSGHERMLTLLLGSEEEDLRSKER